MTIAFWCVLIAAYLHIVWTSVAKFSGKFGDSENHNPREYLEALSGWRKRAHWAQMNSLEAFPPFAAAVIIAQYLQAPQARIDVLAMAFIALRVLYGVFYVTDKARLRSAVWLGAVGCVIAIFVAAA